MIKLSFFLLFLFAPVTIWSQGKLVAPPADSAPMAKQRTWLVQAIGKYGTQKAAGTSVKISNQKIEACVLTYTQTRMYEGNSETTLIRRTRTDSVKDDLTVDLAKLDIASIKLSEHLVPELMALTFRVQATGSSFKDFELVLRQPAADAIKTTLERVARGCHS